MEYPYYRETGKSVLDNDSLVLNVILDQELEQLKEIVKKYIPQELYSLLFGSASAIDDFVNYLYFDTMATLFLSYAPKRPVNQYTTALFDQSNADYLTDSDSFQNIVTKTFIEPDPNEYDENDDEVSYPEKYTLNKHIQRNIMDMLLTKNLSEPKRNSLGSLFLSANKELQDAIDAISSEKRYPYPVTLLYYYEALSGIYFHNQKGNLLRSFTSRKKTSQEIAQAYHEIATFIHDIIFNPNNFGEFISPDEDYISRAIMLSHLDDNTKYNTMFILAQIFTENGTKYVTDTGKNVLDALIPMLYGEYDPTILIPFYHSDEIKAFLSGVISYTGKPLFSSSSPLLAYPAFITTAIIGQSQGMDITIIPYLLHTWKLLMEYFKAKILTGQFGIHFQSSSETLSLFIRKKYNIYSSYRPLVDHFSVETSVPLVSKPTASLIRAISDKIIHPDIKNARKTR